jgi:hypothetical protein
MSGTASNVATGMEITAALDLFYDLRLNAAVAIFQIFATQMVRYGIADDPPHAPGPQNPIPRR